MVYKTKILKISIDLIYSIFILRLKTSICYTFYQESSYCIINGPLKDINRIFCYFCVNWQYNLFMREKGRINWIFLIWMTQSGISQQTLRRVCENYMKSPQF